MDKVMAMIGLESSQELIYRLEFLSVHIKGK